MILVCVGAAVVVLVAVVSAILVVRRTVYTYRSPVYRFSNLQHHEDENGVTVDLPSATSSNGTTCQQESDDDLLE